MSRRISSIYFYSDSDLFELFQPEPRRFKSETLLQIARSRGILLSPECDRDEICSYLSRLPWQWNQINDLCSHVETKPRSKKDTSFDVDADIESVPIETIVEKAKELRLTKHDETWAINKTPDGSIQASVQYHEIDLKKSKVRQQKEEEIVVEIESKEGGFSVRHTASGRASTIANTIVKAASEFSNNPPEVKPISIQNIPDRQGRTKFFIELMRSIPGFKILGGASKIGVSRAITIDSGSFCSFEEDEDLEESEDYITEEDEEALGIVNKALFEGNSVTASPEYELAEKNSFIYSAVWKAENQNGDGKLVEFEALFREPASGKGFEYRIRGIYKKKGPNSFRKTSVPPGPTEKRELLKLIEDTAHKIAKSIEEEYMILSENVIEPQQ